MLTCSLMKNWPRDHVMYLDHVTGRVMIFDKIYEPNTTTTAITKGFLNGFSEQALWLVIVNACSDWRIHHRWGNNESWTNLWFRNSAFLIIIHLVLNYNGWASLGRWTSRVESIIFSLLEEIKKLSYSWWFNIPDFVRFLNLYSTGKPVICVYQNWLNWHWTYFTRIPRYSRSHPGWRFPWQKFSLSTFHNRCKMSLNNDKELCQLDYFRNAFYWKVVVICQERI